jgi:hypothetical protein
MIVDAIVAAYGQAWNEPDEGSRRALLEQSWTDDGVYCDPTARITGRDALVTHIARVAERMPNTRIELRSRVDQHGPNFRFAWAMIDADGQQVLEGVDFGQLADDGRIRSITGFFGALE